MSTKFEKFNELSVYSLSESLLKNLLAYESNPNEYLAQIIFTQMLEISNIKGCTSLLKKQIDKLIGTKKWLVLIDLHNLAKSHISAKNTIKVQVTARDFRGTLNVNESLKELKEENEKAFNKALQILGYL